MAPSDMAADTPAPAAPKYVAGATGEEVFDVGVGERRYRWTFDGRDFEWECHDAGDWYPLIGKTRFRRVLEMMDGKDGKSWGAPQRPKGYPEITVWTRSPTLPGAKTNEIKLEGIFPDISPESLYSTLNEAEYRATWDTAMLKGYNIAKFSRNNDIGYYEASMPMVSNRDFCNQRAWVELGSDTYMICNNSRPHSRCPTKKGVVRGWSYITAYLIAPTEKGNPAAGTTVTYMTCPDAGGWVPTTLLNMIQTRVGPASMVSLSKAAKGLGAWLQEVYEKHQAGDTAKGHSGRWDKTLEAPGTFFPRNPQSKGAYRLPVMRLEAEAEQVAELGAAADAAHRQLVDDEAAAFLAIVGEAAKVNGTAPPPDKPLHRDPEQIAPVDDAAGTVHA